MLNSEEIINKTIKISINKSKSSFKYILYKAILAGLFAVLGIIARNAAVYNIENDSVVRILGGVFFPIGFIFIILLGGELFTGNALMITAVLDKRIKIKSMIKNMACVFLGNFIGTGIGVFFICNSGFMDIGNGHMAGLILNGTYNKLKLANKEIIFSSILCNIFVCGTILMITATKDVVAKLLVSWFTICTFGILGFEHIVVNMFYVITSVLIYNNDKYRNIVINMYGNHLYETEWISLFNVLRSFSLVTIGNIIGGIFLAGILFMCAKNQT